MYGAKEQALAAVADIIESLEETGEIPKNASELLVTGYHSLVESYRPLLPAASALAAPIGSDLAQIASAFLRLAEAIGENKEFLSAYEDYVFTQAKLRKMALDIHTEAGFTRQEAFALILGDKAIASASLSQFAKSAGGSTRQKASA